VPNVYALAAHPLGQRVLQLAQEEHKTKGFRAVFGVILMFGILCGGVWMLLQSSFGPKQAYLVSSVAFWGCWFVLSIIWLTGVPGISLLGIPRSTPQYYGPQGAEARWVVAHPNGDAEASKQFDTFEKDPVNSTSFIPIDDSVQDQTTQQDKAAAEAAAQELVPEEYAVDLGVGAADITIPGVVEIKEVQLARSGGSNRFARVTFGPATPTATDNEPTKALIAKIKPKTIDLWLDRGSLATPTYYSILLFFVLFAGHTALLVRYELNRVPQPQGAPERVPVSV
jgi:hypothetical protein